MEDIKMAATKAPYAKLKQELDAAFLSVMENMQLEEGPQVQQFAQSLQAYLKVPNALPCANGTEAYRLVLSLLQLPAGAEVLVPAYGDVSVVELLLERGLKPAFADVDADTFMVTAASVEKVISANTAAIVATHLFGQTAPMHELMKIAQQHEVWLIEDATQAFGATSVGPEGKWRRAGAMGHMCLTSFFPVKPTIDSGEGAAVLVNHKPVTDNLQSGESELHPSLKISNQTRLRTLDAAMLDVKIKYVDDFIREREKIATYYDIAFADTELVQIPFRAPYSTHAFHQYTIKVAPDIRDGLQEYLRDNFIPSAIYYPKPLHLLEHAKHIRHQPGDFPVSESLSKSVLSLPMHTELKQEQLDYICHHVLTYVKRHA